MRHDVPAVYSLLRAAWSGLHFALLAALFAVVIIWAAHDGQGARLLGGWWQTSFGIGSAIFHLMPFPWDS